MSAATDARWEGHGDDWPEGQRPCTKCGEVKSFDQYHKHSGCLFGINTICKPCRQEVSKSKWTKVPKKGDLYMVECQGYYKIGIALDAKERLCNMQVGNPFPMRIIKVWPGRADLEDEVHDMLKQYHHRGEWFRGACEL